ncbi:MAG: FtsX-like permease family protein [Lachnospiraceae bacterium]|nr:FtsX-like permease family protein [Lachnospiraceae bacterium]
MNRVLRKRIKREIKANFFRYFALFALIAFCMYVIISLVDAAEIIMQGTAKNQETSNLEDGQFGVFSKLSEDEIKEIEDSGVAIEAHFSFEVNVGEDDILRIFKNRESIDKVVLDTGRYAENDGEIVLEKRYCMENNIETGDNIKIGDREYEVTGIGSCVDYDAPFRNFADTAIDSRVFGLGFVTSDEYERLLEEEGIGSEDLTYAFVLNDKLSADDLKQMIKDFDFDYNEIDDEYYKEMLADTYGKKDEITDGIDELVSGVRDLDEGTNELSEGLDDFKDAILPYSFLMPDAGEAVTELASGAEEIADATGELKEGVEELKDESDEMLDELFEEAPNNLTAFILKEDNIRIGGASGDIEINKSVGMLAGIIIIILFTYVLSVFVIHQIQTESSVIGALYAMGVKKKDLMKHYIFLPTLISFLGGLIGSAFGFSDLGTSLQTTDSYGYYSLPDFPKVLPVYLILYAIAMPPVVSAIVNCIVINKSLSKTALALIKNEQKVDRIKNISLGKLPFMHLFRIRQMIREKRTAFTVIAGMFVSLLIFMMGMDCYVLCDNVGKLSVEDTKYEYLYTYKYPTKEVPDGGTACYIENLKKEQLGYTLDITVMGIDNDNPYIDVETVKGKNKLVISDAVAVRYGVKEGDKIILSDNANDTDYAFTVADVVPYSVGLTVFMDIDSMRELFGESDDYYNAVMSDKELDIEEDRLYSLTSKADTERASSIFVDLMRPMFVMMISVSVVITFIVIYLMTTVMIDRGSFGIALFKIFGFNTKEVKKLYLDGNMLVIALGALVCIPLSKIFMDAIFPMFIPNVACCIHLEFEPIYYVLIFAAILVMYKFICLAITGKLNRITPAEILKNRE